MNKLVVVSMPRTGSTILCEMLAQHPVVMGFGEIFIHEEGARENFHKATAKDGHFYRGPHKFDAYMNYLEALAILEGKTWISFKLMDYQEELAWRMIENDPTIRIVYAQRKNVLESLASSLRSEKTGIWHARSEEDVRKNDGLIEVPEDELRAWHQRRIDLEERLLNLKNPKLTIEYELISLNPWSYANLMFNFIGVDEHPVKITQQKLNPKHLRDRVLNYDILRRRLEKTPLIQYFHE